MKKYAVNCIINETLFIDADNKEEAEDQARTQMEEGYDCLPEQIDIDSIKEI